MTDQILKYWDLLIKEKADKANDEEKRLLKEWSETNEADYQHLLQIFQQTESAKAQDFEVEKNWDQFKTLIAIEEEDQKSKSIRVLPWLLRAAAALVIIFGLTYIYTYQKTSTQDLNLQTLVKSNGSEIKEVNLPDGSTIWLNKNSELLYPDQFSEDTRSVYLKGEAFFDIAHDPSKPFIVHAGVSKTTVMGTSFNLRAYGSEDQIQLSVVTGKVAFSHVDNREQIVLTPGNMASYNNLSKEIKHRKTENSNFLSWKTGKLIFNDMPIREIISDLHRHFDVHISLNKEEMGNCRFTGDFENQSIDNALMVIAGASGFSYEFSNGVYRMTGEGCK